MRGLHLAIHDTLGPSTAAIEFEFGNHLSMSLVHAGAAFRSYGICFSSQLLIYLGKQRNASPNRTNP
jgi:hypothetical protein